MSFRDDPEWEAARQRYIDPGLDDPAEAAVARQQAAARMWEIEKDWDAHRHPPIEVDIP